MICSESHETQLQQRLFLGAWQSVLGATKKLVLWQFAQQTARFLWVVFLLWPFMTSSSWCSCDELFEHSLNASEAEDRWITGRPDDSDPKKCPTFSPLLSSTSSQVDKWHEKTTVYRLSEWNLRCNFCVSQCHGGNLHLMNLILHPWSCPMIAIKTNSGGYRRA